MFNVNNQLVINCNDSCHSCLMFNYVQCCHTIIMLKLSFYKDLYFFLKKIFKRAKGEDFKNGVLHSDFMFVNIEP